MSINSESLKKNFHDIYNLNEGEYLFTSESVSEGHPDKVCDQISDAILDAYLKEDNNARVAVETLATTNKVVVAGEVRGAPSINDEQIKEIVKETIKEIGYEQDGFSWKDVDIDVLIHAQSADIAQGVDEGDKGEEGAGDQGLMFGFACDETEDYMPAPIYYAHKILKSLASARHNGENRLGPDAKAQVTLVYKDGKPVRAASILVSTQHTENVTQDEIREIVRPHIVSTLPQGWMCDEEHFLINPTGKFVIGGPDGDCGLTGRKIIVDTYGGAAPHGGGAFSGKDPTKVDRSAAYMARYLAKNIVAAGLSHQCEIQLAYAIGVPEPVSFYVNLFGSKKISNLEVENFVRENIKLTPRGIREKLDLARPIYKPTAAYGHFGRTAIDDQLFPWERLDLVDEFKKLVS